MDDTFTLLPLHIDPASKAISSANGSSSTLDNELNALNQTHRAIQSLESASTVPPPPLPLNPKRSAAIQKMREQGNASLAKRHTGGGGGGGGGGQSQQQQHQRHAHEAIRLYTYAIEMALGRPPWEPAGIVRDELALLYSNRSQAHIALQAWPEGAADAEASVEMKPGPGQGKAWWRRGRCLLEMGRMDEAEEWVDKALDVEATSGAGGGGAPEGGADLKSLKADIEARKNRRREREKKRTGG